MIKTLDITKDYPAPEYAPVDMDIDWRNGAVVRMPNHLGDAMMALPALMQLRKMLPEEMALYVICPAPQTKIYLALDFVDGIIKLSKPHSVWSLSELKEIKKMRFGAGILFNNSFRDALMLKIAGVPHLYGSDRRMRKLVLTHAFEYPPRPKNKAAEVHQGNRLLQMVRAMGAPEWTGELPEFRCISAQCESSPAVKAACQHPRLMTVAPGAAYGAAKRWPAHYFKEVCLDWIKKGGIVAIVGTPSEKEIAKEVADGLDASKCFDLCGATPIDELIRLLQASVLTVANDSGIMHLGAALGRPGVAVFGPTDHTATGPISPLWKLVITEEKCGPCFKRVCPKNNPVCMLNIKPEEVIKAISEITG